MATTSTKKWISLFLAMVLTLGMSSFAFAASDDDGEPEFVTLSVLPQSSQIYEGQEEGISFTVQGIQPWQFGEVLVDLEEISDGYTVKRAPNKSDTLILTLTGDYLDTLDSDIYTVTVTGSYAAGGTLFTVK